MKMKLVIAAAVAGLAIVAVLATIQKSRLVEQIGVVSPSDRSCDSEAYGMDCRIVKYLEENIAFTSRGGTPFCSYEQLGPEKEGVLYLYVLCEELYVRDGKLLTGGGLSGPVRLTRTADGGLAYWMPRDGNAYAVDMQKNFPKEYRDAYYDTDVGRLHSVNEERAERAFRMDTDYTIEKATDHTCDTVLDCETPKEFLIQSRCPFRSKCLDGKCAVICPDVSKK